MNFLSLDMKDLQIWLKKLWRERYPTGFNLYYTVAVAV